MLARHLSAAGSIAGSLETRPARLRADVETLAVPRHIWAQPDANAEIRDALAERLRALGYEVIEQGELRNLLALPRRHADSSGPIVLPAVAAHYDSVAATPGADDNASALAVLLEVAAASAAAGHPLALIAFNGEEEQMLGSAEFVAALPELGERYAFTLNEVHVLEMLGYTSATQQLPEAAAQLLAALGVTAPTRGDFVLLAANPDSAALLGDILAAAEAPTAGSAAQPRPRPATLGLAIPPGGEAQLPDIVRSDHAPFWRAGYVAMMWTDTAELRNPNYHAPSDTPDTLDYEFMARVCELLLTALWRRL
ncbi:M28 family peptidase [Enhygromyxa salina]|nr:M28 family peptidase [Enhygromyxa salina]